MKLPPADITFLEELRLARDKKTLADALRDGIIAFRTLFNLPVYQAERLQVEMQARGLTRVEYIQELLARKYQNLARPQPEKVDSGNGET